LTCIDLGNLRGIFADLLLKVVLLGLSFIPLLFRLIYLVLCVFQIILRFLQIILRSLKLVLRSLKFFLYLIQVRLLYRITPSTSRDHHRRESHQANVSVLHD